MNKIDKLECYIIERNASGKHSSLLGPFVGYEENEVLQMQLLVPHQINLESVVEPHR
jgi:hypothetical protein